MFGGDPFGNPFDQMRRQMQDMDNMMSGMMPGPFGMFNQNPRRQMLTNGQQQYQQNQQQFSQNNMMNPFGGFGFGGGLLGGLMQQMDYMQNHALHDPNSTVISQSTMISYDGSGQPKIVQNSTRKAGDVKETRRSVQNGNESRMSIGHSIGDRAHVIEKKRDKDGRIRQQQRFVNLDAEEAEEFNSEFKSRASRNLSNPFGNFSGTSRNAIEGRRINANRRSGTSHANAPIITVPDDDEDEEYEPIGRRNGQNSRRHRKKDEDVYVYSSNSSGPKIREITDDDDDDDGSKRRKGLFGKLF